MTGTDLFGAVPVFICNDILILWLENDRYIVEMIYFCSLNY